MCLYPQLIRNPKYQSTKKNGGNIPPITDIRVTWVPIGCGNCLECRKQKSREWQVRLLEDIKTNTNGKFITLTYSNESIKKLKEQRPTKNWAGMESLEGYDLDNEITTRSTRLFLERWRKQHGKSLRHWLVSEIGGNGTQNIHLHGIIWTDIPKTTIEQIWSYGHIWAGKLNTKTGKIINYVNESTVNYITKYINKIDAVHKNYKSKILTSPGIGARYTLQNNDSKRNTYRDTGTTNEAYRTRTGHEMSLPIYWRNKIYNETQRENLWLQKLDKQTRWIRGEKISIKNGEEKYLKLLAWHQQQNTELGYGNNEKLNWQTEHYIKQQRNIQILTRIHNAKKREK